MILPKARCSFLPRHPLLGSDLSPHAPTNMHLADAYYTPEGERKRILALPIEEGREYFETREAILTYTTKHMTSVCAFGGGHNVSVERPIRNEACVTAFNSGQLGNPWAFGSRTSSMASEDDAGVNEKGEAEEVGLEFAHEFPELRPCNRCAASSESCDAPETVATALHYLQTRKGYTFPCPLPLQYGATPNEVEGWAGQAQAQHS